MKRLYFIFLLMTMAVCMHGQQYLRVWNNANDNTLVVAQDMVFSDDRSSFTIGDITFDAATIDSISVLHTTDATVYINYSEAGASVNLGASDGVSYTISGGDVTINNKNEKKELTFIIAGKSSNGSLTYNGAYKCTLIMDGLQLTSQSGAALDIQNGKRIKLVINEGTVNSLTDAATSKAKACLYSKGHLEVEGKGELTVVGNANHAIASKEYLQLKKTTGKINIPSSKNDAIHVGQYFQMNGGEVTIGEGTTGDGIQVEVTDDPADENNGQMIIKNGTIKAVITSEDAKAMKADSDVAISGGTITLDANGNGSRGIQTDGNMTVSEDDATTLITITAAGGKCTQAECADDPHKCTGIKVEKDLTISAGTIKVSNTGKKAKGIKVDGKYTVTGGTVEATVDAAQQ